MTSLSSSHRLSACVAAVATTAALLLLLCAPVATVEARSSGLLGYCDLTPIAGWPNGKFGKNFTSGLASGVMNWVAAPTPSGYYTIRTADTATVSTDATSYIPGQPMEIHIRTNDLKRIFIGLVLYATNGTDSTGKETPVGDWDIAFGDQFQKPPTCGGKVITHTNANLKPLHVRFWWRAPAKTGTVTFRVLIKQGEQNSGNFYYPIKPLKLTEGSVPTPPTNAMVLGDMGQACADTCYLKQPTRPYCNANAMLAIKDVASLKTALAGTVASRLPLLMQCPYAGTPQLTVDGFATFRSDSVSDSCPSAYIQSASSTPLPDVCYTSPLPQNRGICICSSDSSVQTPNPYAATKETRPSASHQLDAQMDVNEEDNLVFDEEESSAALLASNFWTIAVSCLVSLSFSKSSSKQMLIMIVALLGVALIPSAHAHNYIKSQHRAYEASVSVPCQSRIGNEPHVQVIANQQFEIEWTVGHGDYTVGPFFFAVVPETAYDNLKATNITAILNDYIALAPTSAYITGAIWEKHHIRSPDECQADGLAADKDCKPDVYFKEANLSSTDPSWIYREDIYRKKGHPTVYDRTDMVQTRFQDTYLANDKRVSYASDKYPWIESVSSFQNPFKEHATYARQADIARFAIPARAGSDKNYIVYFNWQGYSDCVDVNVMSGSTPVANRYGTLTSAANTTVIKFDHCEYTYVGWPATTCRKMVNRDASKCIQECKNAGVNSCSGVQVVRAKNPARALNYTVNIPVNQYRWSQEAFDGTVYDPCFFLSVHDRTIAGCVNPDPPAAWCNPATMGLTDNDFVCYGLLPLRDQDKQVEENFKISNEVDNPIFYSSCYFISPPGGFLKIPPVEYVIPPWNAQENCLECNFYKNLSSIPLMSVPDWNAGVLTVDKCQNCNTRNSQSSISSLPLTGANQPNAGAPPSVTYSWQTGTPGECTCAGTQSRSVSCVSSAGTTVSTSFCNAATAPSSTVSCTAPSTCYTWQQSSWSACSVDCGIGTQIASVSCVSVSTGAVVSSAQCTAAAPATQRTCSPKNCTTAWVTSDWGSCTVSCGTGTQTRSVGCYQTQNGAQTTVDSSYCAGSMPASSQSCNTAACQDGQIVYSPWSACSVSCGGGTQTRTTSCVNSAGTAYPDNSHCSSATDPTTRACSTTACPDYEWYAWTWSNCTVACGGGVKTRKVNCYDVNNDPSYTKALDPYFCTMTQPATLDSCNSAACTSAPSYAWSTGAWSTCSATCGGGTSSRTVTCINTVDKSTQSDSACSNTAKPATTQTCAQQGCPTYDWIAGDFSACSLSCGGGSQTRSVNCVQVGTTTAVDASLCTKTQPVASQSCNTQDCAATSVPHSWRIEPSQCSVECGGGVANLKATCVRTDTTPFTVIDSSQCADLPSPASSQACNTQQCPTVWVTGAYGTCSQPCGGNGVATRTVRCYYSKDDPTVVAALPDSACTASKPSSQVGCNTFACPSWKYQGDWGNCSARCNQGFQYRNITCVNADGTSASSSACLSSLAPPTSRTCTVMPCPHWHRGLWGACSKPCADSAGAGTQTRDVICRMPHDDPNYYGIEASDPSLCPDAVSGDTGDGEGVPGVAVGKPPVTQNCNTDSCPSYYWKATTALTCSAPCADSKNPNGGTITASYSCWNSKTNAAAAGSVLCLDPMPTGTTPCNTFSCGKFDWVVGNWTSCSSTCAGGMQNRTVSCRNFQPDPSVHYAFIDVDGSYCVSPVPASTQSCTVSTDVCFGANYVVGSNKNGRCDGNTCTCRPGFTGTYCQTETAKISNVQTNSGLYGTAGVPVNQPLQITWTSDPTTIPYVHVILMRSNSANFPVGDYIGASIKNTNAWSWSVAPPLESGSGYFIRVWFSASKYADSDPFTIADSCAYVSCGVHGTCAYGTCTCSGNYTGTNCDVAPAVTPCLGGWTGILCGTCPLAAKCLNNGSPDTTCSYCTACNPGFQGMYCSSQYYTLQFRFDTDITGWYNASGTNRAYDRWTRTLATDVSSAIAPLTLSSILVSVESIAVVQVGSKNMVLATVRLGLASSTVTPQSRASSRRPSASSRRLLATATADWSGGSSANGTTGLYATYLQLWPQLGDVNSLVWNGQVTSTVDVTWSVKAADPSGQQALAAADAPQDCFNSACATAVPAGGDAGGDSSSKSFIDTIKGNTLYLVLCILGAVLVLTLIIVGAVCCYRVSHSKKSAQVSIKQIATETGGGGLELTSNPALAMGSQWNKM